MPARLRQVLLGLTATVLMGCGSAPPPPAAAATSQPPSAAPDSPAFLAFIRGVRLPGAANAEEGIVPDAPFVSVLGTHVRVDGDVVGDTGPILASHRLTRIDGIFTALTARRRSWHQDPAHAGAAFPGVVMLAFPDDAPAAVVKSVFYTAAFAGFPNAYFLVRGPNGFGRLAVDAQVPGPGTPLGSAGLTPMQVRNVVVGHTGALRACYDVARQRDPSVGSGTVNVSWQIDAHGAVHDVVIIATNLNNKDVEDCTVRQIASWVFDASNNAPTDVAAYPFRFGPAH